MHDQIDNTQYSNISHTEVLGLCNVTMSVIVVFYVQFRMTHWAQNMPNFGGGEMDF